MAIQVTGLFKNPTSQLIHESPLLKIVVALEYKGGLKVDVLITSTDGTPRDTVVYPYLNRTLLTFDPSIVDPYSSLIHALETFLIAQLQFANPINSESIFTRA